MRTNEERIEALHRRTSKLQTERKSRISYVSSVAGAATSLALVIALAIFMSSFVGNISVSTDAGMRASIFADSPFLGYVIVGLVAFILGISFTIFCFRLKRWNDEEKTMKRENDDDRND